MKVKVHRIEENRWVSKAVWMAVLMSIATVVCAEVPIQEPVLGGNPTGIAPAFFGPNALPIPDMLDGRTDTTLQLEMATDAYWGKQGDKTANLFARLTIPLWTPRVNLKIWMPIIEWYSMTPQRQTTCRLADNIRTEENLRGKEAGDVYISTDMHILQAKHWYPDITIRAAIKTASGGSFAKARYFDNPGYFFDAALGKSWLTPHIQWRLSGSAGFLCWQTDNSRQNDAVMYGLQGLLDTRYISLKTTWGGYIGWENYGDRPMSIKMTITGHIHGWNPMLTYQYGIQDYPFQQLRIGIAYQWDILHPNTKSPKT